MTSNFCNLSSNTKPLTIEDVDHALKMLWENYKAIPTIEFHCEKSVISCLPVIEKQISSFGHLRTNGIPITVSPWMRPGEWAIFQDGKLVMHSSWKTK